MLALDIVNLLTNLGIRCGDCGGFEDCMCYTYEKPFKVSSTDIICDCFYKSD